MESLVQLFSASLSPSADVRRNAEAGLSAMELSPEFAVALLRLIQEPAVDHTVRFAAVVYFKNFIKRHWKQDEGVADKIQVSDRNSVKQLIVSVMIAMPSSIQVQLSEAVSIIAENDFPEQWPSLVPELVSKLNVQDFNVNVGVLQTAHSIFKRWRHQFKSDKLFTEIKLVLAIFAEPFLQLFQATDAAIEANQTSREAMEVLYNCLLLMSRIFYSLNSQDLPEYFEDNQDKFMPLLQKYLVATYPVLTTDNDEPGPLEKVKTSICEIVDLYCSKYEEDFKMLPSFVETTWGILTTTGLETKNDMLVSKAIAVLTSVVRPARHRHMFAQPEVLKNICEKIILPNMTLRESDEEQFRDDEIEFLRRDLEGSDTDTRRRSSTDLVRGLLDHFAVEVTTILTEYVNAYLNAYEKDKTNWKAKDTALYLIMALSAKSFSIQSGITAVNELVNPVPILTNYVLPDLRAPVDAQVEPLIKVDALKYIMIFRSQIPKAQLLEMLPAVIAHLSSKNFVVYTYAAVCLERLLSIKAGSVQMFTKDDVAPASKELLAKLFALLKKTGTTPEKVAENDYVMKAILRVIVVCREAILPCVTETLAELTNTIKIVSTNPSNPKFNHFLFEALGALIRHVCAANPKLVGEFEGLLFAPFQAILQSDVSEFMPYVFQLLSQLLSFHSEGGIPEAYQQMFTPLLQQVLWESYANIPALVMLLETYLMKGARQIVEGNQIKPILGIFQKLLSSRLNDHHGLDLLQTIYQYVPLQYLADYHKPIFQLILTRLTQSKTPKLVGGFIKFLSFLLMLDKEGLSVDVIISYFDSLQPETFMQVLRYILLPELTKPECLNPEDRKIFLVAMTKMLTSSAKMLNPPYITIWQELFNAVVALMQAPAAERYDAAPDEEMYTIDIEESGYQASFSKLATANVKVNVLGNIQDPKIFLAQGMSALRQTAAAASLPPAVFAVAVL
ncbi:Exportin-2 [Irineochytrium annulatum]|nr:Exportin-2 [Irineochytrium annulatum]